MKKNRVKEVFLEHLRKVPVVQVACERADISRNSVYRWRSEDTEFAKAMDEALLNGRTSVNDLAETQLISAIKDRNITAIMGWLKHNHPSYKTRVEIEGAVEVIQELSPEQKELMVKALTLANLNPEHYGKPQ
jgi:hypothetical protein